MFKDYIRSLSQSRFWISKRDTSDLLGSRVSAVIVSPASFKSKPKPGKGRVSLTPLRSERVQ